MDNRRSKTYWLYFITVFVFLIFTLGPIIWSVLVSITPQGQVLKMTTNFLPENITLINFYNLLNPKHQAHQTIINGLVNSFKVSIYTILLGIPLAISIAYTMIRFRFQFRETFLRLLLMTIVIPVFTTIIPIFAIYTKYKLLDNLFWISVIYVTAFLPLTTWIFINHFQRIPREMWEAASLDGCNEWAIFWHIILPISRTATITCVLSLFLMSWSQFQIPMILTSSQKNKVITLVLSEFMSRDAIDYSMIAASGLLAILPPSLIAIVFRKELISGLSAGAIK